jgi:hypothetical protein
MLCDFYAVVLIAGRGPPIIISEVTSRFHNRDSVRLSSWNGQSGVRSCSHFIIHPYIENMG